jgi:hypothetical protein
LSSNHEKERWLSFSSSLAPFITTFCAGVKPAFWLIASSHLSEDPVGLVVFTFRAFNTRPWKNRGLFLVFDDGYLFLGLFGHNNGTALFFLFKPAFSTIKDVTLWIHEYFTMGTEHILSHLF